MTVYKNLTGLENLEYFAALAGAGHSQPELRRLLQEAGLPEDAADQRVDEYSKGMRQKVAIAMAMAKQAQALLLDEPAAGLDPQASYEFSQLVRRLSHQQGVAILMATHDLFRAKEDGTRVGIMRDGKLREVRATSEMGHADLERIYLEPMRA